MTSAFWHVPSVFYSIAYFSYDCRQSPSGGTFIVMARAQDNSIKLSKYAYGYFLGYYFWNIVKRFTILILMVTTVWAAVGLIRTGNAFGASDSEILSAFARPLPRVFLIFGAVAFVYALIRATVDYKFNRYTVSPQGLIIETGFLTKHITVVSYAHIQKMTIVANPFDRILKSTTIHIELVGLSAGTVALEGVDIEFAKQFQAKIAKKSQSKISTPQKLLSGTKKEPKSSK